MSHEANLVELDLASIIADPAMQARKALDEAQVRRYARELEFGGTIREPVLVEESTRALVEADEFRDDAQAVSGYVLRDGFHRVEASRRAGLPTIPARILSGSGLHTFHAVLAANTAHGKAFNRADVLRLIVQGLRDETFRDPDPTHKVPAGIPWSLKRLAREFHAQLGTKEHAARAAITRAAKAAAKIEPHVAAELARITDHWRPDAATDSDERPSIGELNEMRQDAALREALDLIERLGRSVRRLRHAQRVTAHSALQHRFPRP